MFARAMRLAQVRTSSSVNDASAGQNAALDADEAPVQSAWHNASEPLAIFSLSALSVSRSERLSASIPRVVLSGEETMCAITFRWSS